MSEEAFADLWESYRPLLTRTALALVGPDDAADALQEAFIRAWRHRERPLDAPGGWFYRIVRNTCQSAIKRRRAGATPLDALPPRPDARPGPHESALRRDLGGALAAALGRINPDQAAAVLLCCGHDLDYHEAAALLGTSKGTIGSRVNRGRLALRPLLADWHEA